MGPNFSKMNFSEYKLKNKEIYLSCLKEHKSGNLAVNWGSEQSQYKRFQVLFDILPNIRNQSILDVGCGIGHFVDFLNMKDLNEKTIEEITQYLKYIEIQQKQLDTDENIKKTYVNDYFNDYVNEYVNESVNLLLEGRGNKGT